ncbi:MAG: fibronectin type III domain-containing protein [Chitinispirillaceae bacterium]|nr:fibronectin type III domain-containing protein [Chitinispirillaceae bacterium]
MRPLKALFIIITVVGPFVVCRCHTYGPVTSARPDAPVIVEVSISEARLFESWREAIRLQWSPPSNDSIGIMYYTLIRKTDNDSVFDIFANSRLIPDSLSTFFDDLQSIGFPEDSYLLVQYRIFAIDSLGRSGDTSTACSLYLARQPTIDTIDTGRSVFRWRTQFIQGSVATFLKLWNGDGTVSFSSPQQEEFGSWDYPVLFSAKLPDSLSPVPPGRWYCAIYLYAMGIERQSLKVDSFNVTL